MGRVAIAPENKTNEGAAGFPAIKLNNKGDKTRFTILEKPWREYVHYIKCPKFDEHGKVKKETKTRKDKSTYEDFELELVGTELCLGDEDTLTESGTDEKNCPACEASLKSGGDIPGPIQRFAVNVAEYGISPAGEIKKPFSASIKVWKFTGRIYDEIEGIQAELDPPDLRKHDLMLECEDPYWNRNKLSFKTKPGYLNSPEGYMKELISTPGNKATDTQLKDACGREVSRARMQDDVDYAMRQWRRLNTSAGDVPEEFKSTAADLDGGIDDLLGTEDPDTGAFTEPAGDASRETPSAAGAETASSATASDDPFEEFRAETTSNPAAERAEKPAEAAPTASPSTPSEASGEDFDFDGLLDGI